MTAKQKVKRKVDRIPGFHRCRICEIYKPRDQVDNKVCKDCRRAKSRRAGGSPELPAGHVERKCVSCKGDFSKPVEDKIRICDDCKVIYQVRAASKSAKETRCPSCGHRITTVECLGCLTKRILEK
jgi:hypothetical protein